MALIGLSVVRLLRLDSGRGRPLISTGATRNSLVVLPLALAPASGLRDHPGHRGQSNPC